GSILTIELTTPDGKKIFPYEYLRDNMTGEGLAYWYCDDGYIYNRTSRICTYGYSYEEQKLVSKFLQEKFKIDSSIDHRKTRGDYYIRLKIKETQDFISIIRPYMIESMKYKIGEKKK
ncbi:hypothetical protein LCGC14_2847400, partial [marine sediment metagenome]